MFKPAWGRVLAWGCAAVAVAGPGVSAWGQDALKYSLAGPEMAEARKRALEQQPYNLSVGSARLALYGSLGVEGDSNINLSETDALADAIITPKIQARLDWPLRPEAGLSFDLGVGWEKYCVHPDYDQITIEPGSALGLTAYSGDFTFDVHERISYVEDPLESGAVSNNGQYGGLSNTAGLSTTWDLNDLSFTTGYDFNLFNASDAYYEYLDRHSHSAFLQGSAQILPQLALGAELSAGRNIYTQPVLSDSWSFSLGPFLEWSTPTGLLKTTLRGGVMSYVFDGSDVYGPVADQTSSYIDLSLTHQLRPDFNHSLRGGHRYELGVNSELNEIWSADYSANWSGIEDWPLSASVFFEHGIEIGGRNGDDYDQAGFRCGVTHQLTEKLSGQLRYGLTIKDSRLQNRDYLQNDLRIDMTYRF